MPPSTDGPSKGGRTLSWAQGLCISLPPPRREILESLPCLSEPWLMSWAENQDVSQIPSRSRNNATTCFTMGIPVALCAWVCARTLLSLGSSCTFPHDPGHSCPGRMSSHLSTPAQRRVGPLPPVEMPEPIGPRQPGQRQGRVGSQLGSEVKMPVSWVAELLCRPYWVLGQRGSTESEVWARSTWLRA